MKILVLNSGSSSVKYQLFDMEQEVVMAKGLVERIGLPAPVLTHTAAGKDRVVREVEAPDHKVAVRLSLEALSNPRYGVIGDFKEIYAVGHRVVHGGSFTGSVQINPTTKKAIEELEVLAPLHNGPALRGIAACEDILPGVPQVAVFDTAFHQAMPRHAYTYSLPYELCRKHLIRRYGFHGTSHRYIAGRAATLTGKPLKDLKMITCHLGNGSSITAVKGGRSIDTSMGFTPLAGLTMGTRCGDIDPAIVTFIMEKEGLTSADMDRLMNRQSGVLGVSGVSSDFRDIEEAMAGGNERARLAWDIFVYGVKRYIGAYAAVLNGLNVLVFTAGLGENSPSVRKDICKDMDYLGLKLDLDKNMVRGEEMEISTTESRVRVYVIPTNEELMIARDTRAVIRA